MKKQELISKKLLNISLLTEFFFYFDNLNYLSVQFHYMSVKLAFSIIYLFIYGISFPYEILDENNLCMFKLNLLYFRNRTANIFFCCFEIFFFDCIKMKIFYVKKIALKAKYADHVFPSSIQQQRHADVFFNLIMQNSQGHINLFYNIVIFKTNNPLVLLFNMLFQVNEIFQI